MGAGVVDHQQVAGTDLRQHPVNGKLVVVFAEGAGDVVFVVAGLVFLAHDGDVVIGAVHGRPHQVGGAGVYADILLVGVFFVNRSCDQAAVGPQQEAAQLGADGNVAHACRHQDFLIGPADPVADGGDIIGRLIGPVGDPHAAGEVDEGNAASGFPLKFHRRFKEDPRQSGVVVVGERVGGQESVDAEALGSQVPERLESFRKLGPGHAVFRLAGVVHDLEALFAFAQLEHAARIVAAGNGLGNVAQRFAEKFHMGEIVQVDDGAQPVGQHEFLWGRVVGGEHDFTAGEAAALRHHQFCQGGAVGAAALFPQDLEDLRIGRGLYRKILPESGIPGKSGPERPDILTDPRFVIQIKGRGVCFGDFLQLLQRDEGGFHGRHLL